MAAPDPAADSAATPAILRRRAGGHIAAMATPTVSAVAPVGIRKRIAVVATGAGGCAPLVRALRAIPGVVLAGEAEGTAAALALAVRDGIDVIVVGGDGRRAAGPLIACLRAAGVALPMLVHGDFGTERDRMDIVRAGAQGVLPGNGSVRELATALRVAAHGATYPDCAAVRPARP